MKNQHTYFKTLLAVLSILLFISCSDKPEIEIPPPKGNYALQFDGRDSHVIIENSESLNPIDAISISMWVRLEEGFACHAGENQTHVILLKGMPDEGYSVRVNCNQALEWWIATENGLRIYLSGFQNKLVVNKWTFLAFTYFDSEALMYVDGHRDMLGYYDADQNGSGALSPSSGPLYFSLSDGLDPGRERIGFPGIIDDVAIWNRVLTAEEIYYMSEDSLDGTEAGLISYWQFNEGYKLTARDDTGNNDGELSGGVKWIDR